MLENLKKTISIVTSNNKGIYNIIFQFLSFSISVLYISDNQQANNLINYIVRLTKINHNFGIKFIKLLFIIIFGLALYFVFLLFGCLIYYIFKKINKDSIDIK